MLSGLRTQVVFLSLAAIVVAAGLFSAGQRVEPSVADVNPQAVRVAIQILDDSISLVVDGEEHLVANVPVASTPAPTLTPAPTPVLTPRAAARPAASPCPETIDVESTGPDSDIEINCTDTSEDGSSGSTNISVSNSVHQSSSGGQGSNHSSSSTRVHINRN